MSGKIYILNTRMTSSVAIEIEKYFSANYLPHKCIIVTPENLYDIHISNQIDNYLICGREIKKDIVVSFVKKNLENIEIKEEDFYIFDLANIEDLKLKRILPDIRLSIQDSFSYKINKLSYNKQTHFETPFGFYNRFFETDEFYSDLCLEFYYTFVKIFSPELKPPKIVLIDEADGFLHIKNSVYKKIADHFCRYIFKKKNHSFWNTDIGKHFTTGFGGAILFAENEGILPFYPNGADFTSNQRFSSFLNKTKNTFGLYYDDTNNTCYVIKRIKQNLPDSFSYKIGNKQYSYMNCIKVPNWLYNTPKEQLDASKILEIKNIDVRTEAIKKLGLEKLVKHGRVVDSWVNYPENEWWAKSEYKLVDMHSLVPPIKIVDAVSHNFIRAESLKYAPFLCMKNQTTGEYHLEGVSPDCRNLYDALKMRYKDLDLPSYEIKDIK